MAGHVGQQIDQYHLMRLLEQRATSEIYLAQLRNQGTPVTIHLFHSTIENENARERFRAEIEPLIRLKHPHLLSIYGYGEKEHIPYLVVATIAGETLRQRYPLESKVELATVLDVVSQVASALQYMHEHGLIHHDIRPEQIWIDTNNTVRLRPPELTSLTMTTQFQEQSDLVDMVAYLAPEQRQGRPEPASDQYSLAVVAYELLSGHLPFQGSFMEVIKQQESAPPPPLDASPGLPPGINAVLSRALNKDPAARFPSMLSFVSALQDAADGKEIQAVAPVALVSSYQGQIGVRATHTGSGYDPASQSHQFEAGTATLGKPMILPVVRGPFQSRDLRIVGVYCAIALLLQGLVCLRLYTGLNDFVTNMNAQDPATFSNLLAEYAGAMIGFEVITAILSFLTSYMTGPVFGAWRAAIINLIYYTGSTLGLLTVFLLIDPANQSASDPTNLAPGTIKFYLKIPSPAQVLILVAITLLGSMAFAFVVGKVYERRKKRNLFISWGIYTLAVLSMTLWTNIAYALATPLLGNLQQTPSLGVIGQTPWISLIIVPPLMVGLEAIIQAIVLRRRQRRDS
ncbi:serine/threonine protein kinase [Ktedonobacter robiniae]|uniref:non-specific serine/threonine protein kinase n=1 Tax=Ktedonobacter robiniae TaxID=2778365 RepID=A0ABQ3V1N5_9CHLR|nr:serine/threonine-protein kinase [Ktedonobacter robiniae]GHO58420.1 hypothetical protein KSB_68950 [Ktedonobacter robiniae]